MQNSVDQVIALLQTSAHQNYIGESVSQLEHALQAGFFAQQKGSDPAMIIAALLHDIGHLLPDAPSMAEWGVKDHESLGAEYLANLGFNTRVTDLIRGHVAAKRYLVARGTGKYRERLSPASQATLLWQGGPMSPEEAEQFAASPLFHDLLSIRAFDEAAKQIDLVVPELDTYRDMMASVS